MEVDVIIFTRARLNRVCAVHDIYLYRYIYAGRGERRSYIPVYNIIYNNVVRLLHDYLLRQASDEPRRRESLFDF